MSRALIMKQLPKAASLKISKHNIPHKEETNKPFNQYEAIARNVFHFEIFFLPKLYFIDFFKCTKTCSMFKVQCNTGRGVVPGGAGGGG